MHRFVVIAAGLLAVNAGGAELTIGPECPTMGTLETVENPAAWADQCFAAVNGRAPSSERTGETASALRDLDLDGVDERLEIRGVGNAMKQIYVFRSTEHGFVYLGELNASPSFTVAADAGGVPTISYIYRLGVDHLELKRIQYLSGAFVEVGSEEIH